MGRLWYFSLTERTFEFPTSSHALGLTPLLSLPRTLVAEGVTRSSFVLTFFGGFVVCSDWANAYGASKVKVPILFIITFRFIWHTRSREGDSLAAEKPAIIFGPKGKAGIKGRRGYTTCCKARRICAL